MKEVIVQIQGLYDCLVKENETATTLTAKLNEGLGMVEKEKGENASQKSDLDKREKGISSIEDVQSLNNETKEAQKQLSADQGQSKIERDAFETYQADTKKEHQALKNSLESSIDAADKKEKKYEEEIENLKTKEKSLKEKIAKELLK